MGPTQQKYPFWYVLSFSKLLAQKFDLVYLGHLFLYSGRTGS